MVTTVAHKAYFNPNRAVLWYFLVRDAPHQPSRPPRGGYSTAQHYMCTLTRSGNNINTRPHATASQRKARTTPHSSTLARRVTHARPPPQMNGKIPAQQFTRTRLTLVASRTTKSAARPILRSHRQQAKRCRGIRSSSHYLTFRRAGQKLFTSGHRACSAY